MRMHSLYWHGRFCAVGKTLRRLAVACDGVEVIEFAIVFPVLLLFLLGCLEFGRLFWIQTELQFAVEAAARCQTVSPYGSCPGTIVGTGANNYAAQHVFAVSVPNGAVSGMNTTPDCGNQVTMCYPFKFMVPTLFPFTNATPGNCPQGYTAPTTGLTLIAVGCHQA
jgi:TadE-like protein